MKKISSETNAYALLLVEVTLFSVAATADVKGMSKICAVRTSGWPSFYRQFTTGRSGILAQATSDRMEVTALKLRKIRNFKKQ